MNIITTIQAPTFYAKPDNEQHAEYPKWVHFTDGRKSVIVHDATQEAALNENGIIPAKVETVESAPAVSLQGEVDERDMLIRLAADRGVKIDKRWNTYKIRAALGHA